MRSIITILLLFFFAQGFAQTVPVKYVKEGDLVKIVADSITVVRDTALDGVILEWWGFQYGTGLNQAQRLANFDAFEGACEYAATNDLFVKIAAEPFEMECTSGKTVTIPAGKKLKIIGAGQANTIGEVFPLVKTETFQVFTLNTGSSVEFEGFEINTLPFYTETYDASIISTTQIKVTETSRRADFLSTLTGETIFVSKGNTQTAEQATVLSVSNDTITLTTALDTVTTGTGKIGKNWAASTPRDTILAYSEHWKKESIANYLVRMALNSTDTINNSHNIFKDVKFYGFDNTLSFSGNRKTIEIHNSYIQGWAVGLSHFGESAYQNLVMSNTIFENNGYVVYGVYPSDAPHVPAEYGGGVYAHNQVVTEAINCSFINNYAAAYRQRASTKKAFTGIGVNKWVNCTFYNNAPNTADYHAYFSESMPVLVTNCYFDLGAVYLNNQSTFVNTVLKNGVAAIGDRGDDVYLDVYNSELVNFRVHFTGLAARRVRLFNCDITPRSATQTFGTQGLDLLQIENSIIRSSSPSTYIFDQSIADKTELKNTTFESQGGQYYFNRVSPDNFYRDTLLPLIQGSILIEGCEINGNFANLYQISPSTVFFGRGNRFGSGLIFAQQYYSEVSGQDRKYGATISPASLAFSGLSTTTTWALPPSFSSFILTGTANRAVFSQGVGQRVLGFSGEFTFIPKDSIVVSAFDAGTNTNSNFKFSGTFYDPIRVIYDPYDVLASGTSTVSNDTVFTLAGTDRLQSNWNGLNSGKIVPGTVTITANGETFTDDGYNNLTGSAGGKGFICYQNKYVILNFSSAPSAGAVVASYDEYNTVYYRGSWKRIN